MIDEHGDNYFFLSCDICGIAEAGPFYDFYEAVRYKKDNPGEWTSWRFYDRRKKMEVWKDICSACLPEILPANRKTASPLPPIP